MIAPAMEPANQLNERITSLYDFSPFNKIVDIGGRGGLIASILKANPRAFGVLLNLREEISEARLKIEAAGLADRCATIGGNFFQSVPAGGDAYIMKWIIHDWDDERATRILKNIRSQILENGRVIIIDCVAREFDELLAAAGFRFLRVIPTGVPAGLPTNIVEAEPS